MSSRRSIRALISLLALVGLLSFRPVYAQSARRLIEEGIGLDKQGRYADALQKFEQARAKAPELTRILLLLAGEHLKLGSAEQALELLESFQQLQPSPDAEEQELLRDGYSSSAARLEQLAAASPQRPELLLFAGRAAFRTRNIERARTLYQRFMQAVPQPPDALRGLRDRYLREFHLDVVQQLPARLQQQQGEVGLWLLLADSHLSLGQEEAALDALDRYREGTPQRSGAEPAKLAEGYKALVARWASATGVQWLLRGRAQFGLGQLALAGEDYARYRQATPAPESAYVDRQERYERDLQESLTRERAAAERRAAEAQARQAQQQALLAQRAVEERRRAAEQRARASRWMIWTSVASLGVGAGLLALGISGLAYEGRCVNDVKPCDQVYDSGSLGIGATVAGSALLVGGGSLLGIGIYRSRRVP